MDLRAVEPAAVAVVVAGMVLDIPAEGDCKPREAVWGSFGVG